MGEQIEFWIPIPPSTAYQKIPDARIQSELPFDVRSDSPYGNRFLHYASDFLDEDLALKINWQAQTSVRQNLPSEAPAPNQQDYLKSTRMQNMTPTIKTLAQKLCQGKPSSRAKAEALYAYVLEHISLDTTESVTVGQGNSEAAYKNTTGQPSDLTALFVALTRASGIPANFVSGLRLPTAHAAATANFHCWAEFYDSTEGWIPVDVAAAIQEKNVSANYFGHLDAARLELVKGRDLTLNPPQKDAPLNLMWLPYVEVNGKAVSDIIARWSYTVGP